MKSDYSNKMMVDDLNENINWKKRNKIFILIIYIMLFLNFDTGAVPASINQLKADLNLHYTQTSLIGSKY